MPTETEELQAKDFLKRAEIRTMRKDLLKLREADSLKERDKIAKIKTLEEQLEEKKKADLAAPVKFTPEREKAEREEVLTKNEGQERIAEKDLKNYATEQERQQIFLLESQRLGFEKQVDAIDQQKDPALKLEKNKLLLQIRDQQEKLDLVLEQERKLEDEQKLITGKEQTTTIPSERKSLEQARWDLDKKIQDVEKKRWEAEKQIEDTNNGLKQVDKSSEQLVAEKNSLRDKILGVDKSLRETYSVVMAREEEKRRGQAKEQIIQKEALSEARAEQKERIQREQWSTRSLGPVKNEGYLSSVPKPVKEKIIKSAEAEEDQRKKFLQDVESLSGDGSQGPKITPQEPRQENILPPPPPPAPSALVPPPPPGKNKQN